MMRFQAISAAATMSAVMTYADLACTQSSAVSDLHRSKVCSSRSNLATAGGTSGNTDINMNNDGGWCWFNLFATQGSFQYVPSYRVAKAPVHGQLVMGAVDKKARITYKPEAGFTGEDSRRIALKEH
jgi:hypothetical protein